MGNGLTFADTFAGIGGFRLGFERAGFECVWTCEIDRKARAVYEANHAVNHPFHDDITTARAHDIPDHDVLVGGFPCQSFSILGKQEGTSDPRGMMFWQLVRILREKQPRAFLFENVQRIASFGIIPELYQLIDDAGYWMCHTLRCPASGTFRNCGAGRSFTASAKTSATCIRMAALPTACRPVGIAGYAGM